MHFRTYSPNNSTYKTDLVLQERQKCYQTEYYRIQYIVHTLLHPSLRGFVRIWVGAIAVETFDSDLGNFDFQV